MGLFDLGHMGRLEVKGPDAARFLDSVVTSFVGKIPVGAIRYGLVCAEDGGPRDDLLLYKSSDEDVFVVANASNCATVLAWLNDHVGSHDVTITDRADARAMASTFKLMLLRSSVTPRSAHRARGAMLAGRVPGQRSLDSP